ncbi:MAG: HAD family hydrolase [Flavobacteriales bacterium]|nr:HAD family hydrolase [Flavobacteriales bacterium]MBP6699536.1 HAD family hydrolase [Flavobacteriales bacterium]
MIASHKAVFLDRDGVINRERGEHTWKLDDFEVLPDVSGTIADVKERGYLCVVISNQSGIGLGLYTHADVEVLHRYLHHHLHQHGTRLDAIYYCPHHPSGGRCLCRKPGSLLLERAIARFGIDPAGSVMVGDRDRDLEAARAVGVRGVLVAANSSLRSALTSVAIL